MSKPMARVLMGEALGENECVVAVTSL
jgi:hypothetical protein